MNPSEVWPELEKSVAQSGIVRRRIHPDAACDLYLGIRRPSGERLVLLGLPDPEPDLPDLATGRGVALRRSVLPDTGEPVVELGLTLEGYSDLFDQLVTDITTAAADSPTVRDAVEQFVGRLKRWQAFLRSPREGLDPDQERGLYGELLVMEDVLAPITGWAAVVRAWTGPAEKDQDFSFGPVAVEVKTTAGKQHQRVGIASERQLDYSNLRALFLAHVSVEEREGAGRTLPEQIQRVRGALQMMPEALQQFEDGLLGVGYFDQHAERYGTGYSERDRHLFRLSTGFPCVRERDIPMGVGEVRYTITVASMTPWLSDTGVVREELEGAGFGGD